MLLANPFDEGGFGNPPNSPTTSVTLAQMLREFDHIARLELAMRRVDHKAWSG
jgi:hypothetical protein